MRRIGRGGIDELKNRSGKCEGPGRAGGRAGGGGGPTVVWKEKFFFKNQKHQPNIVEITHLCIMHRAHT
jgi:hypothetical protein